VVSVYVKNSILFRAGRKTINSKGLRAHVDPLRHRWTHL